MSDEVWGKAPIGIEKRFNLRSFAEKLFPERDFTPVKRHWVIQLKLRKNRDRLIQEWKEVLGHSPDGTFEGLGKEKLIPSSKLVN